VILGHLVPAGTGFQSHQEAEVRVQPSTLDAMKFAHDISESVEAASASD
jgi:hypothetical protein